MWKHGDYELLNLLLVDESGGVKSHLKGLQTHDTVYRYGNYVSSPARLVTRFLNSSGFCFFQSFIA